MMEITDQSYDSLMNMPYPFFESYLKWKTDMERDQGLRHKKEIEKQKTLQNQIKGKQTIAANRSRLKSEYGGKGR